MKFSTPRAFAALAGLLGLLAGCTEGAGPASPGNVAGFRLLTPASHVSGPSFSEAVLPPVSAVIGPEGGAIELSNGSRLVFPAGAVDAPTTVTMSAVPGYFGVDLQPHGLTFPTGHEPVLTLGYAGASTFGLSRLAVVYVNDSRAILEVLPTTWSPADATLTSRLRHFSGYISGGSS
jgi:hypothetical protein